MLENHPIPSVAVLQLIMLLFSMSENNFICSNVVTVCSSTQLWSTFVFKFDLQYIWNCCGSASTLETQASDC